MSKFEEVPNQWTVAQLGAFFTQNRHGLLSFAKQHLKDPYKAEEIVQDALVKVILASPELSSSDHALAYFRKAVQNLIIDHHRAEGRQPQLILLEDLPESAQGSFDDVTEHFDQLASADDAVLIREALSLLSPAERTALVMWEIEGRSISEIASELGVKESSIRHTTSRARTAMRRILSERVVDPANGLTALDLLSKSYKKASVIAKKSSRAALSILLMTFAFLGFNQLNLKYLINSDQNVSTNHSLSQSPSANKSETGLVDFGSDSKDSSKSDVDSGSGTQSSKKTSAAGEVNLVSASGATVLAALADVPTGFKIFDQSGRVFELFTGKVSVFNTETGLMWSNIVSNRGEGPNLLINQSLVVDAFGTSYIGVVSAGLNGDWVPLEYAYVSSDIERLESGGYLVSAVFAIDSAMDPKVTIPTTGRGSDLRETPDFIATKLLLDPTKTKILAQAVLISANSQKDEA